MHLSALPSPSIAAFKLTNDRPIQAVVFMSSINTAVVDCDCKCSKNRITFLSSKKVRGFSVFRVRVSTDVILHKAFISPFVQDIFVSWTPNASNGDSWTANVLIGNSWTANASNGNPSVEMKSLYQCNCDETVPTYCVIIRNFSPDEILKTFGRVFFFVLFLFTSQKFVSRALSLCGSSDLITSVSYFVFVESGPYNCFFSFHILHPSNFCTKTGIFLLRNSRLFSWLLHCRPILLVLL